MAALNTALAAVLAIILASGLGLVIALLRLSPNPLASTLARGVTELIRNTPQLLQIVFWYIAVLQVLPGTRSSLSLGTAVFLNVRGLFMPAPTSSLFAWSLAAGLLGAVLLPRLLPRALVWLFVLGALGIGAVLTPWELPALRGFNFQGGWRLPPELLALVVGIGIYTSAFIAENLRASIQAVARGQREAARSLGLSTGRTMRLVVLPQALRTLLPPLTSHYLNIIKSTTLGAAIAYPEVFADLRPHRAQPDRARRRDHDARARRLPRHQRRRLRPDRALEPVAAAHAVKSLVRFARACVGTPGNAAVTALLVLLLAWLVASPLALGHRRRDVAGRRPSRLWNRWRLWAFIRARIALFFYGPYPAAERWRADFAAGLLATGLAAVLFLRPGRGWALIAALPVFSAVLLAGGIFGLPQVSTADWGGLLLNVVLCFVAVTAALPLGTVLALGRQPRLPFIRSLCTVFIEFWRGVPILAVLFMASCCYPWRCREAGRSTRWCARSWS